MEAPTLEEVRSRSDYLSTKFPSPAGDGELTDWLEASVGLVASLTGRAIGEVAGAEVPTGFLALARRAIVLKIEAMVTSLGGSFAERRSSAGSGNLSSFSAGAYSESYFGPEVAAQAGVLDPNPVVADILWALATEEKKEEWLAKWKGIESPAAMAQSFEWGQRGGGY